MESEETVNKRNNLLQFIRSKEALDFKLMRQRMAKIGHVRIVIIITLIAALSSVLMTSFLWTLVFQLELDFPPLFVSFIVPSVVCPIVMWYVIGVTLNLHHLENEMRRLASYDMLTDIMTRRAFLSACEKLHALMRRNQKSLSLAYIDIDNFKKINDGYGHAAGDEVLKSFARILRENVRKSDLVGRIGGEEFALALPDTDLAGASHILDKVRLLAKHTAVAYSGHTIEYTISIGLSISDETEQKLLDQLIRQADHALYAAKHAGKDCIVEFDHELQRREPA
ncbi:GGDEF domain-containing protein [Methylophaga sp. OBS4]|uniref:GGDEF domain-containing protein n=1 Tax=Methylophaga sp. OBS4 TaxID=2991935 RepID=UPI00225A066A|nr:GGDEF domain-containing protein [Methylophaga sp. OBS4]MCX4187255.1 GGDEF domain-containing protein [Methylophaga sp. OBS4]